MNAREIAERRLAEGEITEEEFDRIVAKIEQSARAERAYERDHPPPQRRQTSGEPDQRTREQRPSEHRSSRQATEVPRSEPQQKDPEPQLGAFGKIVTSVLGLYLAACVLFLFLGVGSIAADGIYKVCTNKNDPFCRCQAANIKNQHTFFKSPLLTFRIIATKPPGDACRHLK